MKNSVKPETASSLSQTAIPKDIQLDAARAAFRNSVGFQVNFLLYSGLTSAKAVDHICDAADKLLAAANPITQDTASPKASNSTTVPDESSVQHEPELIKMLRLRKELDPDAPDAIAFSESSISSTLAEIRDQRSKITKDHRMTYWTTEAVDTLLSIIESQKRTMDFWAQSYLAEHKTWGHCDNASNMKDEIVKRVREKVAHLAEVGISEGNWHELESLATELEASDHHQETKKGKPRSNL